MSVAQTFKIQISAPPAPSNSRRRYPVVIATDGNAVFDMFKGICWLMQRSEREWPAFILVTIGYPGDAPYMGNLLRLRDFTFPGYPNCSGGTALDEDLPCVEPGTKHFEGGEDFQRFIASELVPLVDSEYPTLQNQRIYFGHSMGGSFGLYTLLTRPSLFDSYILSSPATTYDGLAPNGQVHKQNDFMLHMVQNFADNGGAFRPPRRLHLSVGSEEEFDPSVANWRFTSSYYRLVDVLRKENIPGLYLTAEVLMGRNHLTAWPVAFLDGIRAILTDPREDAPLRGTSSLLP